MDGKHVNAYQRHKHRPERWARKVGVLARFDPETGKIMTGNQMFEKGTDDIQAEKSEECKNGDRER